MLTQAVVNAIVQLIVVLIIAAVYWAAFGRKKAGFFTYIGLTAPNGRGLKTATVFFILLSLANIYFFSQPDVQAAVNAENTVTGKLREQGFSLEMIAVILVGAGVQTGLTEEILFRGLIAKRLINGLGFWFGNTVQALLFGAIHLLIFVAPGGPAFTWLLGGVFFLLPALAGWLMGYANEKAGNGSIVPGWLMHALGNAIAYPILAFLV